MKIADAKKLAVEMIVDEVSGLITKVFEIKKGIGKDKKDEKGEIIKGLPWTIQTVILKDDTGEIFVGFGNFEEGILQKGLSISLKSKKTDKHGWHGIKIGEYNGEKNLKVTQSAIIEIEGRPISKPENKPPENKPEPPVTREPVPENKPPEWDLINLKNHRRDCINCATALCAQGRINAIDIYAIAEAMVNYIEHGLIVPPETHDIAERDAQNTSENQIEQYNTNVPETEIPF